MSTRTTLQRILYLLLAAGFAYAVFSYRDQLTDIVDVLRSGVWYFILASIGMLALAIYNQARLYASIYEVFELPAEKGRLLSLYLVTRFVMVVAPSGGLSGWVPFIHDARRRKLGVGTVLIANLAYMILWYSAFSLFLLAGLGFLFLVHDLEWFEVSAAILFLLADVVMIAGMTLAAVAPDSLKRIVEKLQGGATRVAGWIRRPTPIKKHQAGSFVDDLYQAASQIRHLGFRPLLRPFGHALLNEASNLAILFLLATAFALHLSFGVLVAAYSVSILFYIISPTPGGLGFVEGSVILVLTSLGVSRAAAAVVTLAYRGITFWVPFFLGFFALRWANRHSDSE